MMNLTELLTQEGPTRFRAHGFLARKTASYLGVRGPGCGSVCASAYSSSWAAEYASGGTALATEGAEGLGEQREETPLPITCSAPIICSVQYVREGQTQEEHHCEGLGPPPLLPPPQECTHRAGVQAEASQHGACDGIERAPKDGGLLDEGAQAAVVMGTRQINHARQVGQEVT